MMNPENEWYFIADVDKIDSPALVVYPVRVLENIRLLKDRVKELSSLRPHVKTNKMAEVCQIMLNEGIQKFKCATIAEAEMLAQIKAPDVLLAYQPAGPKIQRLVQLIKAYPTTQFSCIVDNTNTADKLNSECLAANIKLNVFIDLNVGMNRTGIRPGKALQLFAHCRQLEALIPVGLHIYDGHISDSDLTIRQQKSDLAYADVLSLMAGLKKEWNIDPVIIIGGSPSFATHLGREHVELSPGTFVFWDWGYRQKLPGEPYHFAALVITRIISIVDEHTVCTDLGHKSVAAENPLPRVHFLNAPDAMPISQSEEHLVVQVPNASEYVVGDVLYGVPVHICPTVALYEKALIIEQHKAAGEWLVIARNRKITI